MKLLSGILLLTQLGFGAEPSLPKATVTVRVVNEQGIPVTNAVVGMGFGYASDFGHRSANREGSVDRNGVFTVTAGTSSGGVGYVSWGAGAEGYYRFTGKATVFHAQESGRWMPWNPTNTAVMKRIINPVPMYARHVDLGMPEIGKSCGYDLTEGDWVSPHGKGRHADILFRGELDTKALDDFDSKLIVSFPNKGDGIQTFESPAFKVGSELRSAHEAPADGYQPEWRQFRAQKPDAYEKSNIDLNRNYYFRVRTVLDDKGRVKSANYGKIYGDFMQFWYYFNPLTNSRNMEFDPKKNLFTTGKSFKERAYMP